MKDLNIDDVRYIDERVKNSFVAEYLEELEAQKKYSEIAEFLVENDEITSYVIEALDSGDYATFGRQVRDVVVAYFDKVYNHNYD